MLKRFAILPLLLLISACVCTPPWEPAQKSGAGCCQHHECCKTMTDKQCAMKGDCCHDGQCEMSGNAEGKMCNHAADKECAHCAKKGMTPIKSR